MRTDSSFRLSRTIKLELIQSYCGSAAFFSAFSCVLADFFPAFSSLLAVFSAFAFFLAAFFSAFTSFLVSVVCILCERGGGQREGQNSREQEREQVLHFLRSL